MLGESLRRQHRDLPASTSACVVTPEHAAEMVDVAVGVDHRDDGPVAAVRAVQRQRGRGGLGGDQRIDDDDAGVALDEADVGQVEAAHLVDALDHLVEPLLGGELGLPPQARVHRGRRVTVEERVDVVVPYDAPVGRLDDARVIAAMNPRSASSKSAVSSNGRVVRCSRCADSMVAVGGFWSMSSEVATRSRPPVLTQQMDVRRVVTGHDASGKSVFVSDETVDLRSNP